MVNTQAFRSNSSSRNLLQANLEQVLDINCGSIEPLSPTESSCPLRGAPCSPQASLCTKGCGEGTCNEETGKCSCLKGITGAACEKPLERVALMKVGILPTREIPKKGGYMCFSECNGKGACVEGVCKCLPGYFGIDCSQFIGNDDKPHLLDHEWRGHRPSPRIYVYELPPEMNAWFDMRRLDRPVEHFFLERLLSSHHRTVDPAQADLFLVPLSTRLTEQIYAGHGRRLIKSLEYIKSTWPELWNRNEGRDHIIFFSGDWGPCEFYSKDFQSRKPMDLPKIMENPIFLSFWGLTAAVAYKGGGTGPCHNPKKDIVLPPLQSLRALKHSPFYPNALSDTFEQIMARGGLFEPLEQSTRERNTTLYFSGGMNLVFPAGIRLSGAKNGYDARMKARSSLQGIPGYVIKERDPQYEPMLASSVFCLSPTGAGWGRRTTLAMMYGCIPVIVQDDVSQPLEEILPYDKFSVRVPEKDIPNLPRILKAIPAECTADSGDRCIPKMQQELACALRSMLWSSIFGSAYGEGGDYDAFVMTMLALQDKLTTWVKQETSKHVQISSMCSLPRAMGCLGQPTPICRFPCKRLRTERPRELTANGMLWPPGGAVCKRIISSDQALPSGAAYNTHISGNTCDQ
ncbi:hypothetical protein CYMTET_24426 [Cymbomonas tetramitiformis]|uniref:EGF-like domain-containing protein n=1 Tax=Cymbomonas tetramitiformis TaxID=36881 RepID=A0AAE0FWQ6_9CHLO|nr:hypothetical protein CYMTET_24426 [Cymbomonas tetramitiformis]